MAEIRVASATSHTLSYKTAQLENSMSLKARHSHAQESGLQARQDHARSPALDWFKGQGKTEGKHINKSVKQARQTLRPQGYEICLLAYVAPEGCNASDN